jgi:curved DNA-binding protein CbpA
MLHEYSVCSRCTANNAEQRMTLYAKRYTILMDHKYRGIFAQSKKCDASRGSRY